MNTSWSRAIADQVVDCDVVIVGSGIAGLSAALGLAGYRVHLLTKTKLDTGSASNWAQGGMAAAMAKDDSPLLHAEDTYAASAGLGDADAIDLLTQEAPHAIEALVQLGAQFDRNISGELEFGREAAHSRWRILHAGGDATGAEVVRALAAAVRNADNVEIFEDSLGVDLATDGGSAITGVVAREGGVTVLHRCRAVILATGGSGQLYRYTTNPITATGDGLAMAARAGAQLADLEFFQFHPTALNVSNDPLPLLTEALRGEGATLIDRTGHRFMLDEHPDAELGPRDVVARGIWKVLAGGGQAYLDCTRFSEAEFQSRFPTIWARTNSFGLNPSVSPLPVVPAAHYQMGGISVNLSGRSSLIGLWACGEVASTGVHGANRLASNSLIEAFVFGGRVAEDVVHSIGAQNPESLTIRPTPDHGGADDAVVRELRGLMWDEVGLVRDESGLARSIERLRALHETAAHASVETQNMMLVSALIAQSALARHESRGAHYRSDYPIANPVLRHRTAITWSESNWSADVVPMSDADDLAIQARGC